MSGEKFREYRTVEGDVLDAICAAHDLVGADYFQRVLGFNPKLCHLPAVLPAGIVIKIPVVESASGSESTEFVGLWS